MDSGGMVTVVKAIAHVAIPLIAFAVGLSAAKAEVSWLWRNPARLARSLLVVLVLVPLAVAVLAKLLPLPPMVRGGLVIMAICIGPVAGLKRAKAGGGHEGYALGLDLTLLVLSIPYVPIAAAAMAAAFGREIHVSVAEVAKVVLLIQLLPLSLGLLVARVWPRLALRIVRPATVIGNVLLGLLVLVVLVPTARPMLDLGAPALLAMAAVVLVEVAIGHLFGGPDAGSRLVLATFGALRFPALALVLATAIGAGPELLPVVMAYLLISVIVLGLYSAVTRLASRRHAQGPPAPAGLGPRPVEEGAS